MIQKFAAQVFKAIKTDFVKVSAWSAVSTLIRMITGFVSIKVVAQIIGPSGIALVGQFINSITMIGTLGTGCVGQGVTKYIAEHYDEPEKQKRIIVNSVRITLVSTIIMSLLVILFYKYIGASIFKTNQYNSIILLFGVSIGLYSFNTLFISILNGFKAFKKFVIVNVASSIAGLILSIILVLQFGVYGALLNCVVSQSVIIAITLFFIRKEHWFSSIFSFAKTDTQTLKKLGKFTIMALTSVILVPLSQIAVRSYIADHISMDSAGLWEAMNRISGMYLVFITTSISTFYLPRLSELKENFHLKQEIVKTMKIVLPPLALVCLTIFLTRDILIHLLFTQKFEAMRELFALQMVGDFFKMAAWLIAFLFWAKAMLRTFIITEIIFNVSYVLFARIGVDTMGLPGSVYAYALNYTLYFMVVIFIFRKTLVAKNN